MKTIGLASDHAGFELKDKLVIKDRNLLNESSYHLLIVFSHSA